MTLTISFVKKEMMLLAKRCHHHHGALSELTLALCFIVYGRWKDGQDCTFLRQMIANTRCNFL